MITIIDNEEMNITLSESFKNNIKAPDGKPLSDYILNKTVEKFNLYKKIFNKEKLDKISFLIFDNLDEWREYYRNKNNQEPPEYSRGSFDSKLRLSYCFQHSDAMYNTTYWYSALCTNAHEAFHLFYKQYIYKTDRIVWFDEGLAQYFSGAYDYWLYDEEKLKEEFIKYNNSYKHINNLNERIQGNSMVSDDLIFKRENVFDGYKTSILIIKYLEETKGFDYIVELMKDNEEIRKLGNTAIDKMRNYFIKKYELN